MNAAGWQARALSWVLAVFATLAIVGAVATMSTAGPGGGVSQRDGTTDIAAVRVDPRTGEAIVPPPAPFTTGAPPFQPTPAEATAMRQADALRDIAGWLEALTYAVLALVAVAGVGVLALFRMLHRAEH